MECELCNFGTMELTHDIPLEKDFFLDIARNSFDQDSSTLIFDDTIPPIIVEKSKLKSENAPNFIPKAQRRID